MSGVALVIDLAVELEHEPQHAVSGRMRRPHVEDHFFAEIIARFRLRMQAAGERIGRFDFADTSGHIRSLRSRPTMDAQALFPGASTPGRPIRVCPFAPKLDFFVIAIYFGGTLNFFTATADFPDSAFERIRVQSSLPVIRRLLYFCARLGLPSPILGFRASG